MTVYIVSPATTQEPIGGIRKIYDQVDILNGAGIDAAVIQGKPGYRPTWFPNTTRIEYAPVEVRGDDLLVWPEYLLRHVRPDGVRQVVAALNAYGLFADDSLERHPFADRSVAAVTVVSDDNAEYVRYGWPHLDVQVLRPGIDPSVFFPGTSKRQIAYSPRKRYPAVRQVIGLLRERGALDGWQLAPIVGMNETRVAATLRESALFLSFSEREGLGLPPLEALASGCQVIGFTGVGGREFFGTPYAEAIPEDDVVAYARAVESWLAHYDETTASARGRDGSKWVLERYSVEQERAATIDFYARLLAMPPATGTSIVHPSETWGFHDRPRSAVRIGLGQVRAGLRTMRGR
ncbi:MAG TPA: glycosyltransferase [Jatrophihabitantaceae bacterium]|nr:glycosyltransferase [Jatrophihabitantaceae bacterium]